MRHDAAAPEALPVSGLPIAALRVGGLAPFGPRGAPSGIVKFPVDGPWRIDRLGLEGDAQGDRRLHGGPEKALHHYPAEHYPALAAILAKRHPAHAQSASRLAVGDFGENVSTVGLCEESVCLGDIFALGPVRLQLSQGRQPCWKLGWRTGIPPLPATIQASGRTGWYYRVLSTGRVQPGDRLTLIERPCPAARLATVMRLLHRTPDDYTGLTEILALPVLPPRWRAIFERRLETRSVEDFSARLGTPEEEEPRP